MQEEEKRRRKTLLESNTKDESRKSCIVSQPSLAGKRLPEWEEKAAYR